MKSRSNPPILLVMNHADLFSLSSNLICNNACIITAVIIDNQDFHAHMQRAELRNHYLNTMRKVMFLIIGGNKYG